MLMAGLGGCGGPRVSHRGREGAGRAGLGGGVFEGRGHSSGGPLCPWRAPAGSAVLFSAWALDVQGQTPVPVASPGLPSVWTSKGDDKPGRIWGPWWTRRTLDVHLTPAIRAPRNPGSLTLSGGPEAAGFAGSPDFRPLLCLRRPLAAPCGNSTYPPDDAMGWRASPAGAGTGCR